MTDLYLIRHAESIANRDYADYISGGNNLTLTPEGVHQSMLLGKRIQDQNIFFDDVHASPLDRTRLTALISQPRKTSDSIWFINDLVELNQGAWLGRKRGETYTLETQAIINKDSWNFAPPGGESQHRVAQRMMAWHNRFVQPCLGLDKTIGVYGHSVAFKCFLAELLDQDRSKAMSIPLDNTSITHLRYQEGCWTMMSLNDTSHLVIDRVKDRNKTSSCSVY